MMQYIFESPKLRPGVKFNFTSELTASVNYKDINFDISFESNNNKSELIKFLNLIESADDYKSLVAKAIAEHISEDQLIKIIASLDEAKLIYESPKNKSESLRGIDLLFDLEDCYYNEWLPRYGESDLTTLVLDGDPDESILVGWAIEYYHITSQAHDAILSILPLLPQELKKNSINFFAEEYRHDKLMLRSLESFGIHEDLLIQAVPLPATQAYINLLAHWGKTDPLSYMASLFIYEGEVVDYSPYIDALRRKKMPENFVKGQEVHNDINVNGDHGGESRVFLREVSCVSIGHALNIKNNMHALLKIERKIHEQVVAYYSNPYAGIPRVIE